MSSICQFEDNFLPSQRISGSKRIWLSSYLMLRSSLLAYIALSLFLGQANLPMFTHVCHGMGKSWTALVKPPKACCGKQKKDLREHHLAPTQPKSCDTIDKSRCCEDHIKYASLSVQLIQSIVKTFVQDNGVLLTMHSLDGGLFSSDAPVYEGIIHVHGPPGKLSGRELLIAHQLFLC